MESFVIEGGKRLEGVVRISGAKNAAMPILTSTLLIPGHVTLTNVPDSCDPQTLIELMKTLGVKANQIEQGTWTLDSSGIIKSEVAGDHAEKIRGSQTLLGTLLARNGHVKLPKFGGCKIGDRPIDLHIKGLKALGAEFEQYNGTVEARIYGKLKGAHINLDFPSVGATENIMLAATIAEGTTIIENAAEEPEVADLATFLNASGAQITGAGSSKITIHGVSELKPTEHTILPDRIEAGTFMIAGAITCGDVIIEPVVPSTVDALIIKLQEAGVTVHVEGSRRIHVKSEYRPNAVNIVTRPYPGFATDLQPQMSALLCLAGGSSVITETIFENRFAAVPELIKMGCKIDIDGKSIIVKGIPKLTSAEVKAPDIRGGAALILAGLAAEGTTTIKDVAHIDRGYVHIDEKLRNLGAKIKRITTPT